jgi:hypothetical protein
MVCEIRCLHFYIRLIAKDKTTYIFTACRSKYRYSCGDDALYREMTTKLATNPGLTEHPQLSGVAFQHVLDNRQAQTESSVASRSPAVNAKKTLGQSRNMLG